MPTDPSAERRPVVLFAGGPQEWSLYEAPLRRACAERRLAVEVSPDADPGEADYVVYSPASGLSDFGPFTRLKAVLSLWAGVERIAANPTLTVPLARMVDRGLTEGMRDYVAAHVLRYHVDMDAHLSRQDGVWRGGVVPPLARERTVVLLGLGALGHASAEALASLGFRVLGWSRSPKPAHPLYESHHGAEGLTVVLSQAEILVLLLPATRDTANLLDAAALARLPRGARIINPGRGSLIDDRALLDALETGHVAHATLDTFREEPLPADHPFWAHPHMTVTPHIAAETRPATAADTVAENIRRAEAGLPLLHQVDRNLGY